MKDIETAVNAWYKQWLEINDQYMEDFDSELYKALPHLMFTYCTHSSTYILIGER